jgi:hypothetical protein
MRGIEPTSERLERFESFEPATSWELVAAMSLFPAKRTTSLPGGYMGKILRVDLTTGLMTDENLPEEPVLKKFIGGQSLASYILLRELPFDANPFGAENVVAMMTGPLTGNGFL